MDDCATCENGNSCLTCIDTLKYVDETGQCKCLDGYYEDESCDVDWTQLRYFHFKHIGSYGADKKFVCAFLDDRHAPNTFVFVVNKNKEYGVLVFCPLDVVKVITYREAYTEEYWSYYDIDHFIVMNYLYLSTI